MSHCAPPWKLDLVRSSKDCLLSIPGTVTRIIVLKRAIRKPVESCSVEDPELPSTKSLFEGNRRRSWSIRIVEGKFQDALVCISSDYSRTATAWITSVRWWSGNYLEKRRVARWQRTATAVPSDSSYCQL